MGGIDMRQEDKELLLKNLCARLPYGIKYNFDENDGCDYIMDRVSLIAVDDAFPIEDIKPYLFPLSSMTEEQKMFLKQQNWCIAISTSGTIETTVEGIDWLNKNHFDINNLIPIGLGIDATGLNIY